MNLGRGVHISGPWFLNFLPSFEVNQVLKWSRLISQGATGAPEEDAADVHQQERERLQLLRVKMPTFHLFWQIFTLVHILIILLIHLLHVPFPIKSQMFWPYLIHFTVYISAVSESFKLYFFCVVWFIFSCFGCLVEFGFIDWDYNHSVIVHCKSPKSLVWLYYRL